MDNIVTMVVQDMLVCLQNSLPASWHCFCFLFVGLISVALAVFCFTCFHCFQIWSDISYIKVISYIHQPFNSVFYLGFMAPMLHHVSWHVQTCLIGFIVSTSTCLLTCPNLFAWLPSHRVTWLLASWYFQTLTADYFELTAGYHEFNFY